MRRTPHFLISAGGHGHIIATAAVGICRDAIYNLFLGRFRHGAGIGAFLVIAAITAASGQTDSNQTQKKYFFHVFYPLFNGLRAT